MKVAVSVVVLLSICTSVPAQEPAGCPNPEDSLPDNLILEEYPDGRLNESSKLRVRCAPGYVSHGPRRWTIECVMEGWALVWTKLDNAKCRPVSCGHPGFIRNGMLRSAVFTFPNSVKYECDVGYKAVGRTEIYCQSNGRWDEEPPRCEVVRCGSPEGIGNGTVEFHDDQYGSVARYICPRGYKREGEEQRTCGTDGIWSGSPPVCNEVTCAPPGNPDNGGWADPPEQIERPVDFEVSFYCPGGMTLLGSDMTRCLEDGIWLFDPPQCKRNCHAWEQEGGHIARRVNQWLGGQHHEVVQPGTMVPPGQTVYLLQCRPGYEIELKRSVELECRNGEWWPIKEPICDPSPCRNIRRLQYGHPRKSIVEHNDKVEYECSNGYDLINGEESVCSLGTVVHGASGQPTCNPKDCKLDGLPHIDHGRPKRSTGPTAVHGTRVDFECDNGYELSARNSVICFLGQWQGQPGHCMPKGCGVPPKVPNGFHILQTDTVPHNARVFYHCQDKYLIEGDNDLRCMLGTFQGTRPSCKKDFCDYPAAVSLEGIKELKSDRTGAKLEYECVDGYETNSVKGRCENGTWSLEEPIQPLCKRTFCDNTRLPLPAEGMGVVERHNNGETLRYECVRGYNNTGAEVTCENGTWVLHSSTDRFCRTQPCDPSSLPVIENGRPKPGYEVTTFSKVEYECAEGYYLAERSNVTCLAGEWKGRKPVCQAIHGCVLGPRNDRFKAYNGNQRMLPGIVPHGTTLRYHCEPVGTLVLKGNRSTICNNGTWDARPPYCYGTPRYGPKISITANPSVVGPGGTVYVDPNATISVTCEHGWRGHMTAPGYTIIKHYLSSDFLYKLSEGENVLIECTNGADTNVVHFVGRRLDAGCPPLEPPVILAAKNSESFQVSCRPPYEYHGPKYIYCLPFKKWSYRPVCHLPVNTTPRAMAPGAFLEETSTMPSGTAPTSRQQYSQFTPSSLPSPPALPADKGKAEMGIRKSHEALPTASPAATSVMSRVHTHGVTASIQTTTDTDRGGPRSSAAHSSTHRTGEHTSAQTRQEIEKPSLAGPDHVHNSTTRGEESGAGEQVLTPIPVSSDQTDAPSSPSKEESKKPVPVSSSHRPCTLRDIDNFTKIFVGYQKIEGRSSFPDGFSATFHCEPVGRTVGGPVNVTCEDGQWISRTMTSSNVLKLPICHSASDVHINVSADYIVGPEGILFAKRDTSVNLMCSHGEPSILNDTIGWSIRIRTHEGKDEVLNVPGKSALFSVSAHESYVCECKLANVSRRIRIEEKDAKICSEPVLPYGLRIVQRDETRLRFRCDGNMTPHGGNETIECVSNGLWDGKPPSCINGTTPVGGATRDHDLYLTEAPPRTTDTQGPVDQVAQVPAAEHHVSHQQTENETVPTQIGKNCSAHAFFEKVSRGVIIDVPRANVSAGSSFEARCEAAGHVLAGDSGVVTCQEGGTWNFSQNLRCEEGCSNFAPIDPRLIIEKWRVSYQLGDSITLRCPEGYATKPHVERMICMGSWTADTLPKCVPAKTGRSTPRPRRGRAGRRR